MTEKMKPSGIAWIGDIPTEWDLTKVRFATKVRSEKGYYCAEDKYIGLENISSYTGKYIPAETEYDPGLYDIYREGDVLFSKLRPYLAKALIADDNGFCTGELEVISDYLGDKRFLFYYLLSDGFLKMVDASTYGTKMPRANWEYIKNLQIPVVPCWEQCAIADYLDAQCAKIDSVIADIEKQIEILQKYKKSLITETVTKGLDRSVPMKDSGFDWVPQIPTSWGVDRLGNISNLRNGYVGPTKDILVDEGEPYIQSLHVKNGKIVFGEDFYVTVAWGKHHPKIAKGDILLVQTGEIGQIALVDEQYDGCNCHALIICSPDAKRVYPSYLLYYLMSSVGNSQLMIYETGTTLKHLNSTKIKNSKVIIPPVEVQKDIADFLDVRTKKIDAIIETKQKQMGTMLSHKKSLIYEYVTGKKRVTEVN